MRRLPAVIVFLTGCEALNAPQPVPTPTFCPCPTPTPEPTPSPVPTPRELSVFVVPSEAPLNSPVTISLCEPYRPNIELWVDGKFKVGTFGENRKSGCMQLTYVFNTAGLRVLTTDLHRAEIFLGTARSP